VEGTHDPASALALVSGRWRSIYPFKVATNLPNAPLRWDVVQTSREFGITAQVLRNNLSASDAKPAKIKGNSRVLIPAAVKIISKSQAPGIL
jgi:hypothetical protein